MSKKGFSLIELLVVVAIILIIASIAIPAMLQARKAANESAAVGNLRALANAEFVYASRNSQNFGTLADMNGQNYTDSRFSSSGVIVSGYQYNDQYPVQGQPPGTPTSTPSGFGLEAVHQDWSADYDFEVGIDSLIRYGPAAAPGKHEGHAYGKGP